VWCAGILRGHPRHSGSCVADSGRVRLFGLDVVPGNMASILKGTNQGVGVCPYETFVWKDLTVQEHMLVMGMVYGACVCSLRAGLACWLHCVSFSWRFTQCS
jgi:ABC-type multidrug transport system ATPase subunit